MSAEAFKYSIYRERSSGPFGLVRRREQLGQISEGDEARLFVGGNHVSFTLEPDSQALVVRSAHQPVIVEMAAEPQRLKPTSVVAELNQNPLENGGAGDQSVIHLASEIRTGRRSVTVYSRTTPSEKLVLQAPKFEPFTVTRGEARGMVRLAEITGIPVSRT